MSERFKSPLSIGILALIAATSADAAELCVKCTGPDASYACVVGGVSNATIDTVAKLYCITALAKLGSHASCSVDRTAKAPCQGERKELPLPSLLDASGDDDQPQDTAKAAKGEHAQAPQKVDTPQTLPSSTQIGSATPPHDQPLASPTNEAPRKRYRKWSRRARNQRAMD